MPRVERPDVAFWLGIAALAALRLLLVSDLHLQVVYSPHDDSMYVARAYHLLAGEAFGPYDSTILAKYPGISLWLAAMRTLHVPYLLSIHVVGLVAGGYMVSALRRAGAPAWVALAAFALYVLNPITYGEEWFRVLREPLGASLFVAMLAATAHMMLELNRGGRPWGHAAVFAVLLAFSLLLREDDRLLWGFLLLVALVLTLSALHTQRWRSRLPFAAAFLVGCLVIAKGYEYGLREYYARWYGVPILHELSEGEYPRLIAALRSIRVAKDNRMVAVSQETLRAVYREIPQFRPVVERLDPPGRHTFSCFYHGVCSEWASGWMALWIRDAAFRAGLTPTLQAEQEYYRQIRHAIEQGCSASLFACVKSGEGLVPPMELRWTRGYVAEAWRLLRQFLAPDPHTLIAQPAASNVPADVVEKYKAVTLIGSADAGIEKPALAQTRVTSGLLLRLLDGLLLLGAGAVVLVGLWRAGAEAFHQPLGAVAVLYVVYAAFRIAALSYVAVFMGGYEPRMMFSLHLAGVLLAVPAIWWGLGVSRRFSTA